MNSQYYYHESLQYYPDNDNEETSIKQLRLFYEEVLKGYPDILTVHMIAEFTGYAKASVQRWLLKKDVEAFKINRKYIIPKFYFISFLTSNRFSSIVVKSQRHKELIEQFNSK